MKRNILLLLLCFEAIFSVAQNITGKVINAKNEPVPFANIILLSQPDSTYIKGVISDEHGLFTIASDCKKGILKISSIGYQTIYKSVDGTHPCTIQLAEDNTVLGEVVIKGHLPQYKTTSEGLLTNIEGTVLSKAGTADDVLKHIPTIVKKKDGYEVFGKGSPVIYVNGRRLQDVTELDNIKSTDVKSVEVIQNPGASYDASAQAIVKIKTVKPKDEGLAFDTRSLYWYNKDNNTIQQLNMNYQHGGLLVFATYKYYNSVWRQNATFEQTVYVDTLWHQDNIDKEYYRKSNHTLIGGFNYDLNANHSIGLRYQMLAQGHYAFRGTTESLITANNKLYDKLTTWDKTKDHNRPKHQVNAYYNGVLGKTKVDLNIDLLYNKDFSNTETIEESQEYDSRIINKKSEVSNKMIASKLVLESPLLGGQVNYGAQYYSTCRKDRYEVDRADILPNSYCKIEEQSSSAFLQYSHTTLIGKLTGGIRYEYVNSKYYADGVFQPEQSRSYSNFFPSLSVEPHMGKVSLLVNYSVRTGRPSYSQLSNYVSYMNRFSRSSGNPYLKNATNHAFGISATWKCIQLSANYTDSRNAIIYWGEQLEENPAITLLTYKNEKSVKRMNVSITAAPKIGFWSPQISLGIKKQWLKLHTSIGTYQLNKPVFRGSLYNTFSLPWGLTCTVDYNYQSKGNDNNFYLPKELHILDLGIRKTFLYNKLTFEIKGNDLLNQFWSADKIYNDKMQLVQYARYNNRDVTFTLRYKFNNTHNKYKGKSAAQDEINRL